VTILPSSLGRQRRRMLLGANPARVVASQRLQQLFSGKIGACAEDVAHHAFEDGFAPIQIVLASLELGVVGEQQGFQLAVHPLQDLKWTASTASPSAALIAVWVSSQDSCNWARRAFTKSAARRSMNSGSEVAEFSIRPKPKSRCKALSCRGRKASLSSAVTKHCRCQSRNRWHSSDHRWTWPAKASVMLPAKSTSTGKVCSVADVAFMVCLYARQVPLASLQPG
jgi:hypothetical protein